MRIKRCDECGYCQKEGDFLVCRRFPPIRIDTIYARYPVIQPHWWCGEFKHRDEREY